MATVLQPAVVNFSRDPHSVELREIPVPTIGPDDVLLEAVTSPDMATWTPATLVSDVPGLNGKATRTWQAGTSTARRVFIKVRASRVP